MRRNNVRASEGSFRVVSAVAFDLVLSPLLFEPGRRPTLAPIDAFYLIVQELLIIPMWQRCFVCICAVVPSVLDLFSPFYVVPHNLLLPNPEVVFFSSLIIHEESVSLLELFESLPALVSAATGFVGVPQ